MNDTIKKFVVSSQNPKQLSMTITGALTLIVPLAGLVIRAAGGHTDDATLQTLVDEIGNVVVVTGTLVSSVMMIVGAIRKLVNSFK